MDTKLKRNSGFWPWLAFFMGVNLVALSLLVGLSLPFTTNYSLEDMAKVSTGEDVKSIEPFKKQMSAYLTGTANGILGKEVFEYRYGYYNDNGYAYYDSYSYNGNPSTVVVQEGGYAYEMATGLFGSSVEAPQARAESSPAVPMEQEPVTISPEQRAMNLKQLESWLGQEGENLLYFIKDPSGAVLSNMDQEPKVDAEGQVILPAGYDYALHFDGARVLAGEMQGEELIVTDPHRKDSGYPYYVMGLFFADNDFAKENPDLAKCTILLMVKETLVDNPYGMSALYHLEEKTHWNNVLIIGVIGTLVLGWVLLVLAFIKRQDKRRFDGYLAKISGKFWLEIKVALSFFAFIGFVVGFGGNFWGYSGLPDRILILGITIMCGWWFYLMLLDLLVHKGRFFSHNSISWLLNTMEAHAPLKPFQEKMLSRAYGLLVAEVILVLIAVMTMYTVFIPLCAIGLGVYLIYRYMKQYKVMVVDIGKICDQIERIKQGDMVTPLVLDKDADLAFAAGYLNSIQEGITIATDEKIKSERMKVDLVTNVSHDLKTPLTSIISYVDLLDKEEGLSIVAKDYIHILGQKSERLKSLINDLFDLSKATSANLEVDLKQIDLAKLMRQVGADLEEEIAASGLIFKVSIPLEPVLIFSDGSKLHRVFENLILNTLKYSLANSRVFIDLVVNEQKAWVIIKNIANYEMDFDVETISGRFVRGDKARTTEGSGLGLAIAQSYTEACGGVFEVIIDGDMFKVEVMFDLV